MKKNFLKLLAIIMCLICVVVLFNQTALASDNENEVIVEVWVGDYDEDAIKSIQFDDGTTIGDYNYKIIYNPKSTRDPNYIGTYFSQVLWITRSGKISLSLKPHDDVRKSYSKKEAAWNTLKATTYGGLGSHPNWPKDSDKAETFKWQYDCHYYFANTKSEWNLEPWRTASSYVAVIAKGCNP